MSTTINAYIGFNGQCAEAMNFYKDCFDAELDLMKVEDSPMAKDFPEHMQKSVLHSSVYKGSMMLFATDMTDGQPHKQGNNIAVCITCSSLDEMHTYFERLSQGGQPIRPVHEFFAGYMAVLNDKFGINWMLYLAKENNN